MPHDTPSPALATTAGVLYGTGQKFLHPSPISKLLPIFRPAAIVGRVGGGPIGANCRRLSSRFPTVTIPMRWKKVFGFTFRARGACPRGLVQLRVTTY